MAFALAAALFNLVPGTSVAQRVVVITHAPAPAYQQALAGIRKSVPGAETLELRTEQDDALASTLARLGSGASIVALGARASDFVGNTVPAAPAVSCMAECDLHAGTAMAVVPLAVPLEFHLPWLKRLLPKARTIAVLYDPAQNARYAGELGQGLARAGYTPLLEAVPSPTALPRALERVAKADALLAIPDTTVYTPETAKGLLLFTFRAHLPLIALSDGWVRAGALYALDWDYPELGAHCATLAVRLASTTKSPPPTLPRPRVSINQRTAARLKLDWDRAAFAGVDQTHD